MCCLKKALGCDSVGNTAAGNGPAGSEQGTPGQRALHTHSHIGLASRCTGDKGTQTSGGPQAAQLRPRGSGRSMCLSLRPGSLSLRPGCLSRPVQLYASGDGFQCPKPIASLQKYFYRLSPLFGGEEISHRVDLRDFISTDGTHKQESAHHSGSHALHPGTRRLFQPPRQHY